jgi:hypothetical protein
MIKYCLGVIVIFISGGVAMVNMSRLVAVNQSYEATWWKVIMSILIAIIWSILIRRRDCHER